ncbi:MAG TPA: InlB B-repeat-containing protein [Mobilitalea sp.]|nr:InlB B-repeat-containing protein [Mobilitalea sp.]
MKGLRKILGIVLTLVMAFTLLPTATRTLADSSDYSPEEVSKLQAFLNQPSSLLGKTNGQSINSSYQADDPATWTGVVWTNTTPKHVSSIGAASDWSEKGLAGTLDLSGFSYLTYLNCSLNNISSINVNGAAALQNLFCGANQLSQLDASGAANLELLSCSDNYITVLNINGLNKLVSLYCNGNLITSLDVSNNTTLECLDCGGNTISNLKVTGNNSLLTLECDMNFLSVLDVSNLPLQKLVCNNNLLTTLNLSTNSALQYLDCSSNQLTSLDVSNNTELYDLYCGNNLLTTLDLSNNEHLVNLYCNNNILTSLNVSGISYLWRFDCRYNHLKEFSYQGYQANISLTSEGNGYVGLRSSEVYHSEIMNYIASAEPYGGAEFDHWANYIDEIIHYQEIDLRGDISYDLHAYFTAGEGQEPSATPTPPQPSTSPIPEEPTITPTPPLSPTPTLSPTPIPVMVYQVDFDPNGGTRTGGGILYQFVKAGCDALPPIVEREGYNFVGWEGSYEKVTHDIKVKAIWEPKIITHEVTFNINQGIRTGGGGIFQTVVDGQGATAPTLRRYGYTFKGWDKAYDKVTEDITVTAIWEKNEATEQVVSYKVTYDANGGEGSVPVDSQQYLEGDIATLAGESDLTMDGYQFVGWAFNAGGEALSDSEIVIDGNVTLYAVWEAVEVTEPTTEPVATLEPTPLPEEGDAGDIPKTGEMSNAIPGIIMTLFGGGIIAFEIARKRKLRKN